MFSILRCFVVYGLCLFAFPLHARPLVSRQAPNSITTVSQTTTPIGVITETCVIVFNPVQDAQGNNVIQEVRTCTVSMDANGVVSTSASVSATSASTTATSTTSAATTTTDAVSTTSTTSAATTATATATESAASTSTTSTSAPSSAVITSSATSTTSVETTSTTSSASGSGPIVVIGISTVSAPPTNTASPTTSTAVPGTVPIVIVGSSNAPLPSNTPAITPTPSATTPTPSLDDTSPGSAAAANSPSTTDAAFTLPGKKLSVLPIGLGVFAGISVIALIVVGLVTYERTKYRKAFRQRKLAESGAAMGYGGNAQ